MKKNLLILGSLVFVGSVFAINVSDLKNSINSYYNQGISKWKQTYNVYLWKFNNLKAQFSTWDYKILQLFTGLDVDSSISQIKQKYASYLQDINQKKFDLLSRLSDLQTQFENWLITTGEYEDDLNKLSASVSGYKLFIDTDLNNLNSFYSGLYYTLKNTANKLLSTYSSQISKYKTYKLNLLDLEKKFNQLKGNYSKLEKIIGITKEVLTSKKDKITDFLNKYYENMLDNEFKKYLSEDPNMAYFESWFKVKKELLIGFVDNQLDKSFDKLIKNYYPDIDLDELSGEIFSAEKKSPQEIVKNYSTLLSWLNSLDKTVKDYQAKVQDKLAKFPQQDKVSILHVIENDLISIMNNSTKLIQEDINQTLEWWKVFLQTREKLESSLMKLLTDEYSKALQQNTIKALNNFLGILESYKDAIILPENKKILDNYRKVVENTIKALQLKQLNNKIQQLSLKLEQLQFGDFSGLNEIKSEIDSLYNTAKKLDAPSDVILTLKKLQLQVRLKENLNKLYKSGAIVFYYKYGDLSNVVANILEKYYEKYKKAGKEDIFMNKINKALQKIDLLEQNLNNDLRSYYIIIIHNGLLKFKFKLDNY